MKTVLLPSLLLNLLGMGLGIAFIARRGGITYIFDKISVLLKGKYPIIAKTEYPHFVDKRSHFETLCDTNSEIIFLGDSLTDYCEWGELFRDSRVKNRGIAGDRTDGVLLRIDKLLEANPQKIFIMIAINDLIQRIDQSTILNNYRLILHKIKTNNPQTKIFVQSLLPVNNEKSSKYGVRLDNNQVLELNSSLKELVTDFSFKYIDLFPYFCDPNNELKTEYTTDGVHLNGQAYLMWKDLIEKDVID